MQYLILWLVIINIVTFALCAIDKKRAGEHRWRVRERTLFLLAAAGGSMGLILGMNLLHHKTKHNSFTWGAPLILLLQLIAAALIYQKMGGSVL